jgi:hypothetical protein
MNDTLDTTTYTAVCGHVSDVPAQLCAACTGRLRERLTRLPGLYTALAAWLAPAGRRPELGGSPAAEAPMPLRQEVLDLRGPGGIVGILEDWRAAIHDARGFAPPVPAGSIGARVDRAAQAIWQHSTWASLEWDQAGALATEIARLEARALAVINPRDPSTPIGACPADLGDGTVCGATIRVPAGTQDVHCRGCGTTYPPESWLNLRKWMDADLLIGQVGD